MVLSPLQFAKEWEITRSRVLSSLAGDVKLLFLVEFHPRLEEHRQDHAYQSYFDECRALAFPLLTDEVLSDLSPDEIDAVVGMVTCLAESPVADVVASGLRTRTAGVAARSHFYVGELEAGLRFAAIAANTGMPKFELTELSDLGSLDALRRLIDRLGGKSQPLVDCLKSIYSEWLSELEAVSNEAAYCLLVEKERNSTRQRGRLRLLRGSVEGASKRSTSDKISFHNEIVSPNDPMIGGAYQALEAVRKLYRRQTIRTGTPDHFNTEFRFVAADRKFSGDSLGIAVGVISYAQLAKEDARRTQHSISCEAAFTGALDNEGNVEAVNEDSLDCKIRRAFFSHLRYVVIPESNSEKAREICRELMAKYPRRQLRLVPASRLEEVVTDHNIVRSAKLCIGEWVGRQVGRYSRMTTVQVTLLLVLGYLLLCLLYAKLWIGFDWNPDRVLIEGTTIEAVNSKGQHLWKHEFGFEMRPDSILYRLTNLDEDDCQEMVYTPRTEDTTPLTGMLFVFDDDGSLIFEGQTWISNVYPTDTDPSGVNFKVPAPLPYISTYNGQPVIITILNDVYPARMYVKFWRPSGQLLGWMIGSGTGNLRWAEDYDADGNDDFLFLVFNNRLKCQSLIVVSPESLSGVTPPYTLCDIDLRNVPRLPMKHCVFFMPSALNALEAISDYQCSGTISRLSDSLYDFQASEGYPVPLYVDYLLDRHLRVRDVQFSDGYAKKLRDYSASGKLPRVSRENWADTVRNLVVYYRDNAMITEGTLRSREKSSDPQSQ